MPSPSYRSIKKKILIVSQYYSPDITAAAFRIKETADILASFGHEVAVIAARPHRGAAASDTGGQVMNDGNVHVIRVPIFVHSGKGKWNYILHYFSFMTSAIFSAALVPWKPDLIWASSPPLFTALAGFFISRALGVPFTLDIRDIWPDSAVVTGQLRRESMMFRIAKIIEKFLYRRARFISCVAKPMQEYIRRIFPAKATMVVYNGLPKIYLSPNPGAAEKIMSYLGKNTLNIVYVGNIGFCQNMGLVLDVAEKLQSAGESGIHFLVIGTGVERPALEDRVTRCALKNVTFAGPVGKDEAIELVRNSSALFLQLKDDGTMEKTIPSKVFDYMLGGKPILFGIKGEGEQILSEVSGNIAFEPGNAESLLKAIRRLKQDYPSLAAAARDNEHIVKTRFIREHLVQALESGLCSALT